MRRRKSSDGEMRTGMNGHSTGHLCEPGTDFDEYKTLPDWNICPDGRCKKPQKKG